MHWEKCNWEREIWDFVGWEKFMVGKKIRDFVDGGKNAVGKVHSGKVKMGKTRGAPFTLSNFKCSYLKKIPYTMPCRFN